MKELEELTAQDISNVLSAQFMKLITELGRRINGLEYDPSGESEIKILKAIEKSLKEMHINFCKLHYLLFNIR